MMACPDDAVCDHCLDPGNCIDIYSNGDYASVTVPDADEDYDDPEYIAILDYLEEDD